MAGQLTSNLGDALYAVALPWYVLATHGGALLLGTLLAGYGIARIALLSVGGHASDRWGPWTAMMVADTVRVVAVIGLAAASQSGPGRTLVLIPVAVVLGAGDGLFLPGGLAITRALLPDAELQVGNALASGVTQVAAFIGPAVAGAVVTLLGTSRAFSIDAVTFVISAATLVRVRALRRSSPIANAPPAPPSAAPPSAAPPSAGPPTLRKLIGSERVLQMALLITVAANLGLGGESEVALPALARGPLQVGADGYGGLLAAFGAGALVGAVVASLARQATRPALRGSVAYLAGAGFLAGIPYLGDAILAGAALAAFGILVSFGNIIMITAFQRWAPPQILGRLMSLLLLASFGIFPISVAAGGLIVHELGPAPFFPIAAAGIAAAIIVGLTQKAWRDFDAAAAPDSVCRAGPSRT